VVLLKVFKQSPVLLVSNKSPQNNIANGQTSYAKKNASIYYTVVIGAVCLLMNQNVLAEEPMEPILTNRIIHPYVGTELTYDANIFRLPKDFTPNLTDIAGDKAAAVRSSFIKQLKAGIAAKWQLSQQELLADISINQNWFSTFHEFNYTGHNLLGQWNWQLAQRLKGELSYSNNLRLASFRGINRPAPNLETKENYIFKGGYEIFPDWFLRTDFNRLSVHYPDKDRQQSNWIEDTKEFGIRYLNPLENMLGFFIAITDGKYPNRLDTSPLDNAYTRTTYTLDSMWNYSVKTRLRGKIGYLSQAFKHQSQLDFSNIVASGDVLWKASVRSSLYLEAWREIYSADNLINSFSLYQGVRLTPKWIWSPKVQLELPISYEQQSNLGAIAQNNFDSTEQQRILQRSEQTIIRLNLNYTPIQNVEMTTFASYEHRYSNDPTHTYQDQLAGFTMKVYF
jgi:hypothetical protein